MDRLNHEKQLLIDISLGDEKAFAALYTYYWPFLTTHLFRITRSESLAEEYAQDVFLKIWTNRETLSGISNFKGYLNVISRNYALNGIRAMISEKEKKKMWESETFTGSTVENDNEAVSLHTLLDAAIDRLPAQQKKKSGCLPGITG